jgi:Flp pilus assembly protein TadD
VAKIAGDKPSALTWLNRAVALVPDDAPIHRQLGDLLAELRDFPNARHHLERAVALAPMEADNWIRLIELLKTVGDNGAAESALAAGLFRCPRSPSLHLERGRRLASAGRLDEALAEFQEARRLRPEEAEPFIESAAIYFRLNRLAEGEAELRRALTAQPENPAALSSLAFYAMGIGDEAGAAEWLRHVRRQSRISPKDLDALVREFQKRFGHAP